MLKTLLSQVKEYKTASLLAPLFTALEVVMELFIPFITAAIIDQGIEAGDLGQVYRYGALMIVMAFSEPVLRHPGRKIFRQGFRRLCLQPCGTPSTPRCRPSRFPTSTSTAPPGWSPV